jgi:tetratricopeptide (TPR) repeat protein
LKADPDNPELRILLAKGLLGSGEVERAASEIRTLLKQYPRSSPVQTLAGTMYVNERDLPAAKRAFEQALELDRDNLDALTGLVTLYASTNRVAEAHRLIDSRLAASPNAIALLELAARTYATAGDFPRAEQILKQLIAADATNLSAYGMLGQIYISENRLDAALLEYEKAAANDPTSVAAHTIVAMILEAQNKVDEARKRYQKVLDINPDAVVAANNLAWSLAQQEQNLDVRAPARATREAASRVRRADRRHARVDLLQEEVAPAGDCLARRERHARREEPAAPLSPGDGVSPVGRLAARASSARTRAQAPWFCERGGRQESAEDDRRLTRRAVTPRVQSRRVFRHRAITSSQ